MMKTMRVAGALRRRGVVAERWPCRFAAADEASRIGNEEGEEEGVVANMAVRSPHMGSFSTHFALRVSLLFS